MSKMDSSSMARITAEGVGMRIPDRRGVGFGKALGLDNAAEENLPNGLWAGSMFSTPNLGMTFSHR